MITFTGAVMLPSLIGGQWGTFAGSQREVAGKGAKMGILGVKQKKSTSFFVGDELTLN